MRVKKTKVLRYVVATFLTIGTVLSVGFLSFSGLWIIYPYIIPAILAFFLSGVIEGKVYGTSIFKGLARLKLLMPNAEKYLLFSELNRLLDRKDENWVTSQCAFLSDYFNQRKKYKTLKNDPNAKNEDIKETKKDLEELKAYFFQKITEPSDTNGDSYIGQEIKDVSLIELKSAKRSVWFLRFFWVISILIGIVAGFVTAFAVQEAITVGLALSLSTTVLLAIVWPVALFAAVGATFLLYYAITDIVKNDAIGKACSKTIDLFKRIPGESFSTFLFRLVALSIVVMGITSLTIFATLASGGTCWIVMQKGIKLLAPKLPVFVAYCASTILIPINFATDLIYGFSTTLQTIDNCKSIFLAIFKGFRHPFEAVKSFYFNIRSKLITIKQQETWAQFFNPFRILAKLIISPLQSLVFLGHLISIGLTTDRFMNVPPPLVAGVCAISEGLQDLSFLTAESDDHQHVHNEHPHHAEDDGHDHGNLLQLPLQVILSPLLLLASIFYWMFKKFGHEVYFFEAVKNIFELPLLNIIFFPLLFPSAIWHWIFKKSKNSLTFSASIKKSFDIHVHDHQVPQQEAESKELSKQWQENERVNWKLKFAEKRLNGVFFGKNNAVDKQKLLKLLALNRKEIIEYIKVKLQQQPNISLQEVIEQYFNKNGIETSKINLANGISNFLNGNTNLGHLEQSINNFMSNGVRIRGTSVENKQLNNVNASDLVPIKKHRGFFSCNSKPTTTETLIEDAFSFATSA
ncbi:MAG: hypothetical protein E6K54_00965 [Gammaproteobacteria bacterium]|nr:MAG: hypothetical protein E6K54_00965 [Gammaproteobacteria bacterium]